MARKHRVKSGEFFCGRQMVFILLLMILAVLVLPAWCKVLIGGSIRTKAYTFTESSRVLKNPNRGFYHLYSFTITDDKTDYEGLTAQISENDADTKLMMAQINIQFYKNREITKQGLDNIRALLDVLEMAEKRLIIRFVYDKDGKNEQNEPESMDIILKHMEQLEGILKSHSRQIFIVQSLFVGNWGEMNGTRYDSDEDFRKLSKKLSEVTDESTYLSVRIPAQWRRILKTDDPLSEAADGALSAGRLGLFNDGMLGNESDYGTYSTAADQDADNVRFKRMSRKEEIRFQNQLCRRVPNGGEVINDNVYNDFNNAVKDLRAMHVSYMNKVYDEKVLNKWKKVTVTEEGCFYGMDGLSYIERHLGYRLVLKDVFFERDMKRKCLSAGVRIKNTGFAPLYREPKIRIILQNEEDSELQVYPVTQSLRELSGGNEAKNIQTLSADIPFEKLAGKKYTVYFSMVDMDTGEHILLGNEEDEEQYGYRIGMVELQ